MSINKSDSLLNIEISITAESQDDVDYWWNLLSTFLAKSKYDFKGKLILSEPAVDEASTLYWLKRALKRGNVQACFYEESEDRLIPHNWSWLKEGETGSKNLLPIVTMGSKRTLFLDRDGVINVDDKYVFEKDKFYFMPGFFDLLTWAKREDFQVVVLTNQSGVGRGYYKEADVQALHAWVDDQLNSKGFEIASWFYSPYHPESTELKYKKASYSRKPGAAMAIQATNKLSIDFENSIMVGDKLSDRLNDLDIRTLFIQGRYDLKEEEEVFESHTKLLKYLSGVISYEKK